MATLAVDAVGGNHQAMRILLHDFAGYPYPIQIARELAQRGHVVHHVYCDSIATTPTGRIERRSSDPDSLSIRPIRLRQPLNKYSFLRRWLQENEEGRKVAVEIEQFAPDVVISANSPLDAHRHIIAAAKRLNVPFVFWVQDLIGVASARLLRKKIPFAGRFIGEWYRRMEINQLKDAAAAILLTADFIPLLTSAGVAPEKLSVIENWAPISDLPVRPRRNTWSATMGLDDRLTYVYAGTLGMKHDPAMLLDLARALETHPDAIVVVLAQGPGAEWLKSESVRLRIDNLMVRDYEPFEKMPEVLGAADVLVGLLDRDAGIFSVPSKILAYLCANRPLLLSLPRENLAARIVEGAAAGIVVDPGDSSAFCDGGLQLAQDSNLRRKMGDRARQYAEATFRVEAIADDFESVLKFATTR